VALLFLRRNTNIRELHENEDLDFKVRPDPIKTINNYLPTTNQDLIR
jgi:hypothetical protein